MHQAKLTNANFDIEIATKIGAMAAEIRSKSGEILGYRIVRLIFGLPSEDNILKACLELNRISYGMRPESKNFENSIFHNGKKTDFPFENYKAMQKVGRLLSIKSTYGEND